MRHFRKSKKRVAIIEVMINRFKLNKIIFWIAFIVIVAFYAFLFLCFPRCSDDLMYINELLYNGVDSNGHHTLAMGVKAMFDNHLYYDHARIFNYLGVALLLVTKWIPSIICALSWGLALWMMLKLSCIRIGDFVQFVLLIFLSSFALPWNEWGFNQMYAFNYVVIIPLFLIAVYIMIGNREYNKILCFFLGLLVGAGHESYCLAILFPGVILMILKPEMRKKFRFFLILGALLGLVWLLSFQAHWTRMSNVHGFPLLSVGISRLIFIWGWFIAAFIIIFKLIKLKFRLRLLSPLAIMTLGSGIILIPIAVLMVAVRGAWPAAILAICYIVKDAHNISKINAKILWALSFVVYGIIIVHLTIVLKEFVRLRNNVKQLEEIFLFANKDDDVVFADLISPEDLSLLSLGRTHYDMYSVYNCNFVQLRLLSHNKNLKLVPQELRYFSPSQAKRLNGNQEMMLYQGKHLVTENVNDSLDGWVNIEYPNKNIRTYAFKVPFTTKYGKQFVYVQPKLTFSVRRGDKPIGVTY